MIPHRHRGEARHLLADEIDAAGGQRRLQRQLVVRWERRADHGLLAQEAGDVDTEGAGNREVVESLDRFALLARLTAPPGRDVRQLERLAQQALGEHRQKTHQRAGFHHAGAERVADDDLSGPHRLDQPRYPDAGAAEKFERVGRIGIDAPPDDVGALEPGDGAHVDLPRAHGQIAAFDQEETEIAGEIGLFEIGLAMGAGGQEADARVDALGLARHAGAELLEEARQPLDVDRLVEVGEGAGEGEAVLQRIARARGGLRAVAQHPPSPVGAAADVGGIEVEIAPAHRPQPAERMQEIAASRHGGRGQMAVAHHIAGAVDVGEHGLDQPRPLGHAARDLRPFRLVDQQRDVAERPRARVPVAIGAVGDARLAHVAIGEIEPAVEFVAAQLQESAEERQPVRARTALRIDEFVWSTRKRLVSLDQSIEPAVACRFSDPAGQGHDSRHRPAGRRMSSVSGNSPVRSSGGMSMTPPVWPMSWKRASRRASASNALTGKVT